MSTVKGEEQVESRLLRAAQALLASLALMTATGCMSAMYGPGAPTTAPTTSPTASPAADPTANWVLVRSQTAVLSLRHPPGWQSRNCEGDQSYSPHIYLGTGDQLPCYAEDSAFQIFIVEFPSDTPPSQRSGSYVGTVRSTKSVTVHGVQGTRVTAEVTTSNPLPPSKGTMQIIYRFTTNGRTYVLYYDREPGAIDLTTDFDLVVESTLMFSA